MKFSAELQQKLSNLRNEAELLNKKEGVTIEDVQNKSNEIKLIKAKLDTQLEIEAVEEGDMKNKGGVIVNTDSQNKNKIYEEAFYNTLQRKPLTTEQNAVLIEFNNALSSLTDADGGFLIPIDQRTAINELKRQFKSVEGLITIEPVGTLSGNRNIEKDAEHTPFAEFTEGNDIQPTDSPQFENIAYKIRDFGGILPIPNNLLKDEKANLKGYLNMWLAKKEVATVNKLVLDLLATLPKTAIAKFDDIKAVFNVTLDPAIAAMSIVVTNQSGWNWLDTQKDNDGKYLMQPMVVDPTKKGLFGLYPVEVFSNKTLKNDATSGTKAPIIMGSLKETVVEFDREQMSLLSTDIGGDAFKKNRTDTRAIIRKDVEFFDKKALVYGQITIV